MVVDTSALLAVLLEEPDGARFLARLRRAPRSLLSAANWLELGTVIDGRKGRSGCPTRMRSWKDSSSRSFR